MFKKILIQTRFGNLLIMALAQWLAFGSFGAVNQFSKIMVILSTCAIAFAGYIINDYFDKNIDDVNKPGRNMFRNKRLSKFLLPLYVVFSFAGIAIGFWYGRPLFLLNIASVALLFVYSALCKKLPFIGNVLVAFLQATVFVPVVFYNNELFEKLRFSPFSSLDFKTVFFLVIVGFAFFTGWLREWVKDMEDREGDKSFSAKTAAILLSEKQNRIGIGFLALFVAVAVLVFTLLLHDKNFYNTGAVLNYYYLFLMVPITIRSFVMLFKTQTNQDWGKLSTWLKIVMFAGVLSMAIY